MVATIQIISAHGATVTTTETPVDGLTIKYKRADNDTNDASDPVPKPSSGNNYSWRKSIRIKVTVTPDGNISNLRWFSDAGSWGAGVKLWAHKVSVPAYVQGSSTDNTTKIAVRTGTGTISSSGTTVTGVGTVFTTQLTVGDEILASGQTRTITAIATNTSLTTDTAFSPVLSAAAFTYGSEVKDASTLTSSVPLTVNSGTVLANPSTGYGTQCIVESQGDVDNTAVRGTKPSAGAGRTHTCRFDES